MSDIYTDYNRVDRAFEKLEDSSLSEPNKQVLKDFGHYLMGNNLSSHKIYRYIQSFRVLSHEIGFNLEDAKKHDLIRLIGKINQNNIEGKDYAPESRKELKKAFKKFYNWKENTENPECLDFMSLTVKKSNRSKVNPAELPTPKQVRKLVSNAKNRRDRAMIYLLWESGARVGELLNLDWENVRFEDDFIRVTINGKTGERTVPVKDCRRYLETWKSFQDDPLDPVFTSLHSGNRLKYRSIYNQLKINADKIGLDCKVNPHAFRKSRATFLASEGANVFQLMEFFGWSQVETAKTYVRLAQSDVDALVKSVSKNHRHKS
jgi:site-specific recombinase XerD